jgi:phage-related protein (TIGR01555 family)
MGVSVGQPDQELLPEQVTLGALKWVHAVSRHDLTCGAIDWNVDSPYYGEPAYYTASNPQGASVKLHPSRVVRFVGLEAADLNKAQGWGDSILEVMQDAILSTGTVLQSVAQLVQEAKLDIVKIPEMSEQLVNAEYEARLAKRFAVANTLKSLYSILIVDKEEDWERIDANFTALPDVLKMYLLVASGAADIPATRMFGQSPAGLSATGDSDTRNYYDRVAAEQKTDVAPALKRLDDVLLMSTLGAIPDGIFYNWNPLWQMTEAEKSDIAVKKANVMTADVNAHDSMVVVR